MPKIILETIINAPREVIFDLSRSIDFPPVFYDKNK